MSQKADGGLLQLGQDTHNSPGKTSSEVNATARPFTVNQSSVVCLPLVSDSQRIIWVSSDQINLQLDGADKLSEAFDHFPYLTRERAAALAQHCSLHPDQVKVWFMAQRLRYGISWDPEDIPAVRKKLASGPGGVMGENGGLDKEMQPEQPKKKKKKLKRMTVPDEMGKKRVKHGGDGVGGRAEGEETRSEGANVETTHLGKKRKAKSGQRLAPVQPWPPRRSLEAPNDLLDASCQTRASPAPPVPCVHRGPLKTEAQTDLDLDGEGVALPGRVRLRARSQAQLEMMQAAFAQCQYPNVEDYNRLSEAIEVPRYALVQWFGDMRYYVKKFHPRWLSGEQYARALATIRDQQHLRSLEKVQPRGSCGEEQSRPVSPKEKTAQQPAGLMPL
ncbi:homeobox and leucine zipper encoding b [Pungitius pungitius]|uniref:homeobox and leucine zipper encoding b n=1 Tax=Pungitius pungitius TaxID=134920 RepID=UPI002E0FD825